MPLCQVDLATPGPVPQSPALSAERGHRDVVGYRTTGLQAGRDPDGGLAGPARPRCG
jgi:hypothetical protein